MRAEEGENARCPSQKAAEEHPEENPREWRAVRASRKEEEKDGGGGTGEKQRRRDLSFAATVQQPFVAGRGEKFAFFVIFFLPARLPLTPVSPIRRSTDLFAFLLHFDSDTRVVASYRN